MTAIKNQFLNVIEFSSRRIWDKTDIKKSIPTKEILALVKHVKKWNNLLFNPFIVYTDCRNLKELYYSHKMSTNESHNKLIAYLQQKNMILKHVSGINNFLADYLKSICYQ